MKKVLLDTTLAGFVHRERPELELYDRSWSASEAMALSWFVVVVGGAR